MSNDVKFRKAVVSSTSHILHSISLRKSSVKDGTVTCIDWTSVSGVTRIHGDGWLKELTQCFSEVRIFFEVVSECLTVYYEVYVLGLLLGLSITREYGAVEVDGKSANIATCVGFGTRACVGSRIGA